MNCKVIDYGTYLEVQVTLSDRNLSALEVSRDSIWRDTRVNDTLVRLSVRSESDEVHYHSDDRDEKVIGEAGKLHRLGDTFEDGDVQHVTIVRRI